jgi:flagellar assembly protein FliH
MTCWSKRITSERRITGVRFVVAEDHEVEACATNTEDPILIDQPQTLVTEDIPDDSIGSGIDVCLEGTLEDVWNAGYQTGIEEGQMAHESEEPIPDTAKTEDMQRTIQILQTLIESIDTHQKDLMAMTEQTIISLACAVAGKVIKQTVEEDHELILRVVHSTIIHAIGLAQLTIRVHPDDLQLIESQHDTILAAMTGCQSLAIEMDSNVPRGGCIINTEAGTIDARLATQASEIEQALIKGKPDGTHATERV